LKKILLPLFLILTNFIFAQQYSFINYGVKEGLAQSQVTDLSQDNLSYLWVGTQSGLSKFNGKHFVNYSIDDGLADNTIHKLLFSKNNNTLWIATPKGISSYKNNTFTSYYFNSKQKVNDLIIFDDSLFIATNEGLLAFKNGQFTTHNSKFNIRKLALKNKNTLYCATNKGLLLFTNSQYSLDHDLSLAQYNFSGMVLEDNKLVFSTHNHGVFSYNLINKSKHFYTLKYKNIRDVFIFNKAIWCIGGFGLIHIQNNAPPTYYSEKNGLPINSIKRVFKDIEGNLWIATYGNGLLKFSGKSVMSYTKKDGLLTGSIMSINQNKKGDFAFGTYGKGLSLYKDNTYTNLTVADGLNYYNIWAVHYSNNEYCWVGTSRGVNLIINHSIININEITGKIRTIVSTSDGTLYFGGKSGLWSKKGASINHILKDSKYDINKIIIKNKTLYLATKNGIYWQNLNNNSTNFNYIKLKEDNCNTITLDSYNNIWVGTVNGLFIISPQQKIMELILDNGNFKSKNILALITDSKNNIWLTTTNGVYSLPKQNPFSDKLVKFHYTDAEGIIDLESNLNALFEDNDKKIWIGTSSALIKIDPNLSSSLFSTEKPRLSIQNIRLFKESFDYNLYAKEKHPITQVPTSLILPHHKNHLTFDFIGINLKNSNNVRYTYRLLGAEDNWSPISDEQIATYSFISPGEYTFQLKATNDLINWTEIESITIIITPPFWQTWWFILLSTLLILFIISLLFKFKDKQNQQKKDNEKLVFKNRLRELEQQSLNASMNRHFIFNSLNSIQYFINISDKRSANKYLSSFAKLIRKNLDSSTADNFMVKLNEEIERITLYLSLEKMRFGSKFDYIIDVDECIDDEMTIVPSMLLQPFVENSIIHGVLPNENEKNGLITINIKKEHHSIIFEVIDNGVGIENSRQLKDSFEGDHESKGMIITADRIDLLRKINGEKLMIIGPFQINDNNGKSLGTKVIIKLPINDE